MFETSPAFTEVKVKTRLEKYLKENCQEASSIFDKRQIRDTCQASNLRGRITLEMCV